MDGVHDMGGMHGFGPIPIEHNEPLFKAPWEARVFAMKVATAVHTGANTDRFRHLIECMPPAEYLNTSYYGRWLYSMLENYQENNLLSDADLASIVAGDTPVLNSASSATAIGAQQMRALMSQGQASTPAESVQPQFAVSEAVAARNIHPAGHTRLPRYARGKVGEIVACHGQHLFADDRGSLLGDTPQHLYTVKFMATALWGDSANPRDSVNLELWEPHLEQA